MLELGSLLDSAKRLLDHADFLLDDLRHGRAEIRIEKTRSIAGSNERTTITIVREDRDHGD